MSYTDQDQLPDYQREISKCNRNGLHQAVWAHRGDLVTDPLATDNTVEVLHIPRGGIWQFEAVVDKSNNKLYIMIAQKNLNQLRKDYQKERTSTHYLYSLLHLNKSKTNVEQLDLLEKVDDEQRRSEDCVKMLGEFADQVDEVIVESVTYQNGLAVKASLSLFDSDYNLIEVQDISDMLLDSNDFTKDNVLGDGKPDTNVRNNPLVKLKK